MRIVLTGLTTCALSIVAATSVAAPLQPPQPEGAEVADLLVPSAVPSVDDKATAGLSRDRRAETLTWERLYTLALVRARSGRGTLSAALDPGALADAAASQGVADFARFRTDFLAGDPATGHMTFHDPSAAVLKLLGRLQTIDNARRAFFVHENLQRLLQERVQGESSGLNRIDLDTLFASLVRGRQKLADEIRQFRDGLDELKIALGLSPRAAVILDRQSLAAFRGVFDSVDSWARQPQRHLEDLPRLIDRLPSLGEVVVDRLPIMTQIETDPDHWEHVLTAAARLAIKNRGDRDNRPPPEDAGIALELRVRRRIRDLFATRNAYEGEKRSYELAIRLQDQAFERLLAPAAGVAASRSLLLHGLIEHVTQVLDGEDRLAKLWSSFRTERLALYRDLGVLPYNDWISFYADLSARPAAADPAAPAQARPADAPAPPAPPAPPTRPKA
jgi:hypothetical protein